MYNIYMYICMLISNIYIYIYYKIYIYIYIYLYIYILSRTHSHISKYKLNFQYRNYKLFPFMLRFGY